MIPRPAPLGDSERRLSSAPGPAERSRSRLEDGPVTRPVYERQRRFFRAAYATGEHGWPKTGPTAQVARLVRSLGAGRGRRALDLGCGEGRHTILLARLGFSVTGVDLEPLALKRAHEESERAGIRADFERADALDLHFPDGLFDVVLDYGCFHHLVRKDWPRYRREISRVLSPRGHLVLSVFSTEFKHHPGELRTRDWLVHRNHYDHFFKPSVLRRAFAPAFDLRKLLVEKEGLNGFLHCLLQVKHA